MDFHGAGLRKSAIVLSYCLLIDIYMRACFVIHLRVHLHSSNKMHISKQRKKGKTLQCPLAKVGPFTKRLTNKHFMSLFIMDIPPLLFPLAQIHCQYPCKSRYRRHFESCKMTCWLKYQPEVYASVHTIASVDRLLYTYLLNLPLVPLVVSIAHSQQSLLDPVKGSES